MLGTLLSSLGACAADGADDDYATTEQELAFKPWSTLVLLAPSTDVKQTSAQGYTLTKTGRVDPSTSTVSWEMHATTNSAGARTLVVTGKVTVFNVGISPATIGNIVVNLDAKNATGNGFTTVASDVADATHGDAATSVKIIGMSDPDQDQDDDNNPFVDVRTVTENAASGSLAFTKGATTPWTISPKQQIPAFGALDLRFTATFNNSTLDLANNRIVRPQLIITQGNAGIGLRTIANVDIDGSGSVSADEAARVRTKARNLGQKAVPAATSTGGTVTITDSAADLATTGDVTFSNPVFAFSGLNGTAKVSYAVGVNGGDITNCAHLTGAATATTCNTQHIAGVDPCIVPGHAGCGWNAGDVITYPHDVWGSPLTLAGQTLSAHYADVYASTAGVLQVGVPGLAGFAITFFSVNPLLAYLPDTAAPGTLDSDYSDPPATSSGQFGSNLIATKLNIDFAEAGYTVGSAGLSVGNLTLCSVGAGQDGATVRQFLDAANQTLGGGAGAPSVTEANTLADEINSAFVDGAPSAFAQDHLVNGACP
jgi:hypothetical protein